MKPATCSCGDCRSMCEHSTCLPTPDEARALIRAGHGARLATYAFAPDPSKLRFVGPAVRGSEGGRGLAHTRGGACTFYADGKCSLHDAGLKPLEGRLALHDRPWLPVRMHVAATWKGRQFDSVLAALHRGT